MGAYSNVTCTPFNGYGVVQRVTIAAWLGHMLQINVDSSLPCKAFGVDRF
jgi:hypothetical protein